MKRSKAAEPRRRKPSFERRITAGEITNLVEEGTDLANLGFARIAVVRREDVWPFRVRIETVNRTIEPIIHHPRFQGFYGETNPLQVISAALKPGNAYLAHAHESSRPGSIYQLSGELYLVRNA